MILWHFSEFLSDFTFSLFQVSYATQVPPSFKFNADISEQTTVIEIKFSWETETNRTFGLRNTLQIITVNTIINEQFVPHLAVFLFAYLIIWKRNPIQDG